MLLWFKLRFVDGAIVAPLKTIKDSSTPPGEIPNPEYENMALSQAFGSVSQNRQLQLHIELQELKKNDLSVSTYLQRAKALADELNAQSSTDLPQENMVTCQSNSTPLLPTPSQNNNHKKSSNWNGNRPHGPCQVCGYRNHTADFPVANYTHGGSTMPWYPDTATNYHITPDLANLSIAHDYNGHDQLHVGNGQGLQITHIGITSLPSSSGSLSLKNVLYVPQIDQVSKKILLQGPSEDGVYTFRPNVKQAFTAEAPTMDEWHAALGHPQRHLKLQRTLQISYGFTLKVYLHHPRVLLEIQAPRAWFHRLTSFLQDLGFQASKADSSLFILHQDQINLSSSRPWIPSFLLGILAQFSANGLLITQRKYIIDMLANSNMSDCKPCHTPMSISPPLSKLSDDPLSNPTQEHWTTVKRLLHYLKATVGFGLFFSKHSTLDLQCFTDSDWGGCPDDCRSTNGYAVI
ncbi:Retrovirus-related Pol polyprotein from transposon RE1 [Vitis vinifera]|uniref:Retrovirus-related Pol polyprotein from transposon RE1 n=1 Tax=Vitis vinifera TaxID=29760 RepID=A0A438CD17_VITVI|nr:Retrovirus-related Pol polyprotein from transposon RE1 [Vitis vinifera]